MPAIELPVSTNFPSLPISFAVRTLIPGVFSGSGTLTRPFAGVGVDALGISWDFFTIPAGIGRDVGDPVHYEVRMLQLAVEHQDLGANTFFSEFHDFNVEGIYLMFATALPTSIHYTIAPGVVVVFYWLLI